ncbi:DUF4328 domain-containing protein, partial [Bacteroidales bacterium OttesenSCG-928-C03]|nr:DUF4328 domain-containing protein [Bacteroidales bacterium OttesenSCG-928-C03]
MKKITDNSIFNKISIALNAGILILFIISMVLLLGFDKVNVEYVHYQRTHDKANEELRTAQQPTRGDSIRLANYKYRLDTLLVKEMPTDKNAAKALTETIERISNNVDEHTKIKHSNDSVVAVKAAIYEPIKEKYDSLAEEAGSKKNTFKWVFTFTLILLVAKIFIFAFWNYKSAINNRIAADWTKKSSKPYWAFLGWIIPAYNFIKPYSFLSEICDDTEYIIENHDA